MIVRWTGGRDKIEVVNPSKVGFYTPRMIFGTVLLDERDVPVSTTICDEAKA